MCMHMLHMYGTGVAHAWHMHITCISHGMTLSARVRLQ